MATWVAVAHAKDAPAVFNLRHLFVCFVNEYASWKHLLVLVYPHYRGPFIQLDCGWSGSRSSKPMSRHRLATSPLARVHSLLTLSVQILSGNHRHDGAQLEATLASQQQTEPRISSGLYQHFKNPKTETFNKPPK